MPQHPPPDRTASSTVPPHGPDAAGVSRALLRAVAHTVAYRAIGRGILHEARNPLQSIMYASQALADTPASEMRDRLNDMIARGAERVLEAIDDLTYLYEHPETDDDPVVMKDIIDRVVALQGRSQLQIAGDTTVELPQDLPPVTGSRQVIEDSLCILISVAKEAVGHDEHGAIRIRATTRDRWVDITVSDTGGRAPDPVRRQLASLWSGTTTDEFNTGVAAANKLMATGGGVLWIEADGPGEPRGVLSIPRWER